ncbi:MAG: hypothetical protein J6Y02_23000 [Pseudobutyrivibrio sp.]|nr:hypothetical protein [Pseudobutyrivibrio sp.]
MRKNRLLALIIAGIMMISTACGEKKSEEADNKQTPEITSSLADEYAQKLGMEFDAPEGIENVRYTVDTKNHIGQVEFTESGVDYVLRMMESERPDRSILGIDCDWDYNYDKKFGEYVVGINRGHTDDKTVDLASWMFDDTDWIYTMATTNAGKEGVDITGVVGAIIDVHEAKYQEQLAAFSGLEVSQLPDSIYSSSTDQILSASNENGVISVTFETVYDYEGLIEGLPVNRRGIPIIPNFTISGNADEIEYGIIGVDSEFQANSNADEMIEILQDAINNPIPGCPSVDFSVENGKITRIWILYA